MFIIFLRHLDGLYSNAPVITKYTLLLEAQSMFSVNRLQCLMIIIIFKVANDNSNGSVQFLWLEKLVEVLIHEAELW